MSMYFEEKGNKKAQTIVFIHGGGVAGWMWQKQWEAFEDFHCIIPDLPEHGNSLKEGHISIEDSAERIADLIRLHANGGRATVVGHSLGGKIIVHLMAAHPEIIDHAVVASALFRPIPMMNLMLNMPTYKLTVLMLKSKWILNKQIKQFDFPNEFYKANFINEVSVETAEMLDRIYSQLNKHLALPLQLEKVQVPTLVIAGEKEPKAMILSAKDITDAMPNAKTFLIKNAMHNYPWAEYKQFNEAIRSFIAENADEKVLFKDNHLEKATGFAGF